MIPSSALRSGRLALADVEAAAIDYDRRYPKAAGRIDAVPVRLRQPDEPRDPAGVGIRRLITKAAVDTLASRFLGDRQGRMLVLCRGSTNQYRNELLYCLVELLHAGGEIPLFPAISDAPTLSAMNHFRLAISSRGVRADGSWTLLDASIDEPALPPVRGKNPLYGRIAEAFAAA